MSQGCIYPTIIKDDVMLKHVFFTYQSNFLKHIRFSYSNLKSFFGTIICLTFINAMKDFVTFFVSLQ